MWGREVLRNALVVFLVALVANDAFAQAGDNSNIVRWAKGTIEYRNISDGEVSGSEEFHLTVHPDGSRTLQARNRLNNADIQRHVTHRVAANFRPLETTAVYWVKGEWRGTGLFAVDGNDLEAVVKTPDGMIRQSRRVPDNFSFIPHPLSTNAWPAWYVDKTKPGPQTITVYDMDAGAQAVSSMLGKLYDSEIEYLGEQDMTTPAGNFQVEHYRISDAVDMYITGPDAILVRFVWKPADRDYVLTSLEQSPPKQVSEE